MFEVRLVAKKEFVLSWMEKIIPGKGRTRIEHLKVQIHVFDEYWGGLPTGLVGVGGLAARVEWGRTRSPHLEFPSLWSLCFTSCFGSTTASLKLQGNHSFWSSVSSPVKREG